MCFTNLRISGGVRICPSHSASNVKIRPRHIATKWEGHGPSRSVTAENAHYTMVICKQRCGSVHTGAPEGYR